MMGYFTLLRAPDVTSSHTQDTLVEWVLLSGENAVSIFQVVPTVTANLNYYSRYHTITDVYITALLLTKHSSDDDSGFRHGFGAEASLYIRLTRKFLRNF